MSTIVRWCTACKTAAAVCTHVQHNTLNASVYGLPAPTSTTVIETFRCQACGDTFRLWPEKTAVSQIAIYAIMIAAVTGMEIAVGVIAGGGLRTLAFTSAVFAPFQLVFLGLLLLGVRRKTAWRRHRIVDDAPVPEVRFTTGTPVSPRRCARCGGVAPLAAKTRHVTQGILMGTDWRFECGGCEHSFVVLSVWRSMMPELIVVTIVALVVARMMFNLQLEWDLAALGALAVVVGVRALQARRFARGYPEITG